MTTYTSIANVIKERRSVRTFTDKAVDKELLIELLNDATWAPNHKHREPWQCKFNVTKITLQHVHLCKTSNFLLGNVD